MGIKSSFPLTKADRARLASEITQADGAEILSVVALAEDGSWEDLRILARGTHDKATAILRGLRPGEILLHNHPSGLLEPSDADLGIAAICGRSGIGFAIHDNACKKAYVVVEPFREKKTVHLDPEVCRSYLSSQGRMARLLAGYEERPGQIGLLEAVVKSFNEPCHAVLEGETGIGKSLAYLVPAAHFAHLNQCRVVISTNTINLQYQLANKDIPLLERVLPFPIKHCLLKGRGNYLCRQRLADVGDSAEGEILLDAEELDQFTRLREWAGRTEDGSLTDLNWEPASSLWEKINADKDACLGLRCPDYDKCFFYRARRAAAEADLLVVNHHLLFADLELRAATDEFAQTAVIPAYRAAVLDEAHNLEEIATAHFGFRTTGFGMQRMLGRLYHRRGKREGGLLMSLSSKLALLATEKNVSGIEPVLNEIREKAVPLLTETLDETIRFFDMIGEVTVQNQVREGEFKLRVQPAFRESDAFRALVRQAERVGDFIQRVQRQVGRLHRTLTDLLESESDGVPKALQMPLVELGGFPARMARVRTAFDLLFPEDAVDQEKFVHFFSTSQRRRQRFSSFSSAPLEVAESMVERCFEKVKTVVLVSATLSTQKNFRFIRGRVGLTEDFYEGPVIEGRFASPFDYTRQAALFVPTDLPEPSWQEYIEATVEPVFRIAQTSGGGTLVLCTSYKHLQTLHERLCERLQQAGLECFRQGDWERSTLLEKFREDGNAVLFATDSFWEGVDVPGNALRNLIITKLPFATPDDPIWAARQEQLEKQGRNPFRELQVPLAAIKLKQGFGRLIRSRGDRGTVWILDKRLVTKFYGDYFLASLPPAPVFSGKHQELCRKAEAFFSR